MKAKVREVLEEQSIIGFTGKVNFLRGAGGELLGYLYYINGNIVNGKLSQISGIKGLLNLLIKAELTEELRLIVEPELISTSEAKLDLPLSVIIKKLDKNLLLYKESIMNRPNDDLNLVIKPDFILEQEDITPEEYSLLCTISDYSRVGDIYTYNNMLDHDITNTLVRLRKKDALKVVEARKE